MSVTCWMPTFALCAMAVAPVSGAQAQAGRRQLVGIVRDSAGAGIEGATVEISGVAARTDVRGAFRLWTGDVDTLTISVRRLGYSALSALLTARNRQWDTVVVEMERTSQTLSTVNVKHSRSRAYVAFKEFEERRAKGNGLFFTREDIVARNTSRVSDILRNQRGVSLVRLRNGFGVRFVAYTGRGPSTCAPDIWLDGQRARGMEIDDVLAGDIEAMELYESFSTTPFQFTPLSSAVPCGAIVIWTRIPAGRAP